MIYSNHQCQNNYFISYKLPVLSLKVKISEVTGHYQSKVCFDVAIQINTQRPVERMTRQTLLKLSVDIECQANLSILFLSSHKKFQKLWSFGPAQKQFFLVHSKLYWSEFSNTIDGDHLQLVKFQLRHCKSKLYTISYLGLLFRLEVSLA